MRCAVLGPLEVRGDDDRVRSVPGAKERHLLAVLAAAFPASVSVDQLLESLWDGAPPRTGRKSLQAHVVRLRTALEPGRPPGSPGRYVVRRHDGYGLAIERDQLDSAAFADLGARGRALLAAGDAQAAGDLLRDALALWRGRPYADWPDATDLDGERRRLEGIQAHVLEAFWEAELALGRHVEAVPELERLTRDEPLQEGWWALHALALYRAGRQGDALETLRGARRVLDDQLGVEPGTRLRELEQAILAQDAALDPTPPKPAAAKTSLPAIEGITGCPYKGLARYELDDAAVFRGRDRLVRTLVTGLVDHRLLVVSGSSGAGKSSAVRAGLLPALRSGDLPGSDQWRPLLVVPGNRPVDRLSPLTGADPPTTPVVLVCDQLEQLWSADVSAGERDAFLDTLLGLLAEDFVARCLLVLRGDHVGRLAEHPDLAEHLHGGLVMVPPMTDTELRQVVEEPARVAGLAVEPDLTDVAVRDVLGQKGALPLLSTALAETWERRRDGTLTLAGYLATGGVTGAVGRSAETAFASLDEPGQELARRILVRLADQDEQATLRARRLHDAELAFVGADPTLTEQVIETLVARRLLARDGDHLEVAHEALLTAWPRLAAWLADDAVGRAVRRHLAPAAIEWEAHGRPDDELYRGTRLEAAAQWAADPDAGPTEVERAFVEAGVARAQAELVLARARADAESAARRRIRRLAGVLAAALVVALVAAVVAIGFQRTAADRATQARAAETAADANRTVADANRLAALSATARSLDVSLLLAAAAVRTADTPATRDGLLNALVEHRRATGVHQIDQEGIEEIALSTDGRTMMATVDGGFPRGRVIAWRTGSADPPRILTTSWLPESVAISPDGRTLAAASTYGWRQVKVWSRDGKALQTFRGGSFVGYPRDIAFTPAGRLLVLLGKDRRDFSGFRGVLAELDIESGRVRTLARVGRTETTELYYDAAFSDDASTLVVYRNDHREAFLLDVGTGRVTLLDVADRSGTSIEFFALPNGAAQAWSDGTVTRYASSGQPVEDLHVHAAAVRDVRVLPGERTAVTVGDGGQVELWDLSPDSGRWSLRESLVGHAAPVVQAEVSSDGQTLLTCSSDGQLIMWDLRAGAGLGDAYPGLERRYVSNRIEVIDPTRLAVAPTRPLSSGPRTFDELPGPDTLEVAATFLDPRTGRVLDEVVVGDTLLGQFGSSVAASPDATKVSVSTALRTTVLDTGTKAVVARVHVPSTLTDDSAWLPDGSGLIVGAATFANGRPVGGGRYAGRPIGGGLYVIDSDDWTLQRTVMLEAGSPRVLEWSLDDGVLAVGVNFTHTIILFDDQLRMVRTIELGTGGDVSDLSFSPDGTLLAVGRGGGVLSVIDTSTWQAVHDPVRVHAESVLDVEWLPDGNTVVTAGQDELLSLYDVERDLVRARALPASDDPGDGFTFLMPGPTDELVVFNEGEPGHVFPVDPAVWLAEACMVAGRDLTRAEWDRYLPDTPYYRVCDLD